MFETQPAFSSAILAVLPCNLTLTQRHSPHIFLFYISYTTTCGTEGNLLGVLYGREKLPDGILYCSRDSHYSVPKSAHLYRIPLVSKLPLVCRYVVLFLVERGGYSPARLLLKSSHPQLPCL